MASIGATKSRSGFSITPRAPGHSGYTNSKNTLTVLDWLLGILISVGVMLAYLREWTKNEFEWPGKAWTVSQLSYVDRVDLDPIFGVLFVAVSAIVVLIAVQWLAVSFDHVGSFAKAEMLAEEAPPGMRTQTVVLEPAQLHPDLDRREPESEAPTLH